VGTQGPAGQKGDSGSSGTSGSNGASIQGAQGAPGNSGSSGTSGGTGAQGADGAQGSTGGSGSSGTSGGTGSQGPAGQNGTGTQGPQGAAGSSAQVVVNNNTDNNVLTATGGSSLNGEPNLTFNGSTLSVAGSITATGNITAYYSSDRRQKDNIIPIESALDKVKSLTGVLWNWNENADEVTKQLPNTGLIAQDVKEVLPQVVIERQDGYLALDYSKMIGLLVQAIKELEEKISK
jgi:hypothetical protein